MKPLLPQGFSLLGCSLPGTRFPADSRAVCQKFARKFDLSLKMSVRSVSASSVQILTYSRHSCTSGELPAMAPDAPVRSPRTLERLAEV